MKFFYLAAVGLVLSSMVSCGDEKPRENFFESAEAALSSGDYRGAVSAADSVLGSADTASMDWKDYCRGFVVYAVAYDKDNTFDQNDAIERSERCLRRARKLNEDSTQVFLMGQPGDRLSAVQGMMSILKNIEESKSLTADDFADDHDIDPDNPDVHSHGEGHGE